MGKMLLLLSLVLVLTDRAEGQSPGGIDAVATRPLTVLIGDSGAQAPVFTAQPTRRCCSKKGALIGAAIGAGLGLATALLCDGSDCMSGTAKAMAILAGVGAAIGAMTRHPSWQGPRQSERIKPSIVVAPVVLRSTYGGAVSVRF
jgi:hypothetical protein